MEVGTWVKWSAEDFSYVGQIKKIEGDDITFITEEGEMTVKATDGKFETTWSGKDVARKVEKAAREEKAAAPKAVKAAGLTKREQAIELVRAYVAKHGGLPTRSEGIKMLVAKLGMTEGGASTYFNEAKKAVA